MEIAQHSSGAPAVRSQSPAVIAQLSSSSRRRAQGSRPPDRATAVAKVPANHHAVRERLTRHTAEQLGKSPASLPVLSDTLHRQDNRAAAGYVGCRTSVYAVCAARSSLRYSNCHVHGKAQNVQINTSKKASQVPGTTYYPYKIDLWAGFAYGEVSSLLTSYMRSGIAIGVWTDHPSGGSFSIHSHRNFRGCESLTLLTVNS